MSNFVWDWEGDEINICFFNNYFWFFVQTQFSTWTELLVILDMIVNELAHFVICGIMNMKNLKNIYLIDRKLWLTQKSFWLLQHATLIMFYFWYLPIIQSIEINHILQYCNRNRGNIIHKKLFIFCNPQLGFLSQNLSIEHNFFSISMEKLPK